MRLLTVLKLPYTKAVLNLALLVAFCYQIKNSWKKLEKGQLGTIISNQPRSGVTLPDFTFCFITWPSDSNQSLVDQHKELLKEEQSSSIRHVIVASGDSRDFPDPKL